MGQLYRATAEQAVRRCTCIPAPVTILAMADSKPTVHSSPWRRIFEQVRTATGNQRDEHGTLGSINWLRKQMELRNANPNVVRNIIYRDKGKLERSEERRVGKECRSSLTTYV